LKLTTDVGLTALSIYGPVGSIAAFGAEVSGGKEAVVRRVTKEILKRRVDAVKTVENRVREK